MPNTKSAIRRVRRVKKQTQVNRIRKSKYKNAVKQMELLIKNKEKDKSKKYFYKETVNSLGLEDFKKYFKKTKMEITDVFGDYQLNNFVKNKSPRLIIIFKKKSQPN